MSSQHYAALAQWVESARQLIEGIDMARMNWPDLDDALRARDLITGMEWGGHGFRIGTG